MASGHRGTYDIQTASFADPAIPLQKRQPSPRRSCSVCSSVRWADSCPRGGEDPVTTYYLHVVNVILPFEMPQPDHACQLMFHGSIDFVAKIPSCLDRNHLQPRHIVAVGHIDLDAYPDGCVRRTIRGRVCLRSCGVPGRCTCGFRNGRAQLWCLRSRVRHAIRVRPPSPH